MAEYKQEVAASPYANTDGQDASVQDDSPGGITVDSTTLLLGWSGAKGAIGYDTANLWDTSSIPLGSTINESQIAMRWLVLRNGDPYDVSIRVHSTPSTKLLSEQHLDDRFCSLETSLPFLTVASSNDDVGTTPNWDIPLRHEPLVNGSGITAAAQVWESIVTETYFGCNWRLERVGSPGGFITARLYDTVGSAGSYTRGALLWTSNPRPTSDVPTSYAGFAFGGSGTPVELTTGERYITELTLSGTTSGGRVLCGMRTTLDGSTLNQNVRGTLQGYSGSAVWVDGAHVMSEPITGTPDTWAVPDFTPAITTIGSAGYSPTFVLANFLASITSALDARASTDDWLAVTMESINLPAGASQSLHYARNPLNAPTDGTLTGVILYVDYTPPPPLGAGVESRTFRSRRAVYAG